jgi:phosphatidylinositol phospholipase C, delta
MDGLSLNMVELCTCLWDVTNNSGSSIKFQDVVSVIAKFAFIVTPYPLILSMEIHCGTDQQIKMAKIFRETLGRELLLENLEGIEDGKLPSPEDLKYKILLKVHSYLSCSS